MRQKDVTAGYKLRYKRQSYCALHLRACAEHMNNTNAHTTIHNPYGIAGVHSSTIMSECVIVDRHDLELNGMMMMMMMMIAMIVMKMTKMIKIIKMCKMMKNYKNHKNNENGLK